MTSTDLMNVNAFENQLPDAAFSSLNPADENLADGIGSSYGIVGYRGKVWSLRYRGEHKTFVRADDGSPAAFLDVIILRSASYKSKSYYPAGSFDTDSAGARPVCAALDGVTPDSDVAEKQASSCAICPRNEWKQEGARKGKECADYKRMAVLILPSQSKLVMDGVPLMEPVFLRVPAASLNDLALLGEAMAKKGFHYTSYITRIGFQADKAHPQMTFRALQKLTSAEAPLVLPMREEPMAYRITGENEVGKPKPAALTTGSGGQSASQATQPSTAQTTTTVASQTSSVNGAGSVSPKPTTTTSPSEPKVESKIERMKRELAEAEAEATKAQTTKPAEPETVDTGLGAAKVQGEQTVIPPDPKPKPADTGMVDTGFGLGDQTVVEVVPSKADANTTTNTVADTGPAEESDADLDARVANLLK